LEVGRELSLERERRWGADRGCSRKMIH
jgi:hypothetical protein